MLEKHYTPKEALPFLGLKHENDVRDLINRGLLKAKRRLTPRGSEATRETAERQGRAAPQSRGRYLIPESAIQAYLDSCPDAQEHAVVAAADPRRAEAVNTSTPRRPRRRQRRNRTDW